MPNFGLPLLAESRPPTNGDENGGQYGLAMGSVPSKAIPSTIEAITDRFVKDRERGERFQAFISRLGRKEVRAMLEPFMKVPAHDQDASYYTDWGDPREFTIGDMGVGECAGEVVSLFSMEISKAESECFEASLRFTMARISETPTPRPSPFRNIVIRPVSMKA